MIRYQGVFANRDRFDPPKYMQGPQPPRIAHAPGREQLQKIHDLTDDALALLPADELLDAALEVNRLFRDHRDPRIIGYYQFFIARLRSACIKRMGT